MSMFIPSKKRLQASTAKVTTFPHARIDQNRKQDLPDRLGTGASSIPGDAAAWNFTCVPVTGRRAHLQAKLTVGAVDDPLEREADQIAERVMRMPDPASTGTLQRKCASCEKEERQEKHLSRKATNGSAATLSAPPIVHDVLSQSGRPLDSATRAFFEPRFGQDFSHVRLHDGAGAARSASSVQARAYTVGSNLVFGVSQYNPGHSDGRRLIAHELAHVVQQSGGSVSTLHRTMDWENSSSLGCRAEACIQNQPICTVCQQLASPFWWMQGSTGQHYWLVGPEGLGTQSNPKKVGEFPNTKDGCREAKATRKIDCEIPNAQRRPERSLIQPPQKTFLDKLMFWK